MGINKIDYYGRTLIDLRDKTVRPEVLHAGETAKNAAGEDIVGTFTIDDELVAQDELLEEIQVALENKSAPTIEEVEQATPEILIDANGLITVTSTQAEGKVSAGTKTVTKQLTTQAAKTVTPSTSNKTAVDSGVYTTGAVIVAGDSNLKAQNIAKGVTIFGVTGTHEPAPTFTTENGTQSPPGGYVKSWSFTVSSLGFTSTFASVSIPVRIYSTSSGGTMYASGTATAHYALGGSVVQQHSLSNYNNEVTVSITFSSDSVTFNISSSLYLNIRSTINYTIIGYN